MIYVEPLPTSLQAPVRPRSRSSSKRWTASDTLAVRWPLHRSCCEGRESVPPPITFALCPPHPQRPCRDGEREQCHRCDERERPETPTPQASRPGRERRRFDIRQAELRLVIPGFLSHEQQRCRPAVQGCDAHNEMCPSLPACPMLLICTARPRADMPNVCARSRSRGSAVRAAHPPTLGAPPTPGIHWRRFFMMSGPPFPPGR